jgi:hypothetical protein
MNLSETLAAIAKLRIDAERIERALCKHVAAERNPVAHAKLHRLHSLVNALAVPK